MERTLVIRPANPIFLGMFTDSFKSEYTNMSIHLDTACYYRPPFDRDLQHSTVHSLYCTLLETIRPL